MIDVTRTVIRCERLPSGFDGFRITQVSDLHDAVFGEEQSELLEKIRETEPDLIALTGDFIGSKKSDVGRMLRFMEKLPGIGQARAQAIIAWREENGAFAKIEDIMKVPGIKKSVFNRLKDRIKVGE